VPAHLQETAIELAVLPDKHGLDRRLHVVVDAARAGASVNLLVIPSILVRLSPRNGIAGKLSNVGCNAFLRSDA
jgi:hypothetical protein